MAKKKAATKKAPRKKAPRKPKEADIPAAGLTLKDMPTKGRLPRDIEKISDIELRQRITEAWWATQFLLRDIPLWRRWCEETLENGSGDSTLPGELLLRVWRSFGTLWTLRPLGQSFRCSSPEWFLERLPQPLPGGLSDDTWIADEPYLRESLERLEAEPMLQLEADLSLLQYNLLDSPSIALDVDYGDEYTRKSMDNFRSGPCPRCRSDNTKTNSTKPDRRYFLCRDCGHRWRSTR